MRLGLLETMSSVCRSPAQTDNIYRKKAAPPNDHRRRRLRSSLHTPYSGRATEARAASGVKTPVSLAQERQVPSSNLYLRGKPCFVNLAEVLISDMNRARQ